MWTVAGLFGVFSPENLLIVLSLIVLEGVLSTDNALVLAMMVRHLPEKQQKKALVYGIWGAYLFRFAAITIGLSIIKIWWVKLVGALYLLSLAWKFFAGDEEFEYLDCTRGFWGTVAAVECMDVAFSFDSILAAFGVSGSAWVLFIGGCIGVLCMRLVADVFIRLLNKIPEFETVAYILIATIGLKMVAEVLGFHFSQMTFVVLMVAQFVQAYFINKKEY